MDTFMDMLLAVLAGLVVGLGFLLVFSVFAAIILLYV